MPTWSNFRELDVVKFCHCPLAARVSLVGSELSILQGVGAWFGQCLCHLCSIFLCKDLLLLKVHPLYYFLIRIMSSLYSPRCACIESSCFLDFFFTLKNVSSVFSEFEDAVCEFSRLNTSAELFSAQEPGLVCHEWFGAIYKTSETDLSGTGRQSDICGKTSFFSVCILFWFGFFSPLITSFS